MLRRGPNCFAKFSFRIFFALFSPPSFSARPFFVSDGERYASAMRQKHRRSLHWDAINSRPVERRPTSISRAKSRHKKLRGIYQTENIIADR